MVTLVVLQIAQKLEIPTLNGHVVSQLNDRYGPRLGARWVPFLQLRRYAGPFRVKALALSHRERRCSCWPKRTDTAVRDSLLCLQGW